MQFGQKHEANLDLEIIRARAIYKLICNDAKVGFIKT